MYSMSISSKINTNVCKKFIMHKICFRFYQRRISHLFMCSVISSLSAATKLQWWQGNWLATTGSSRVWLATGTFIGELLFDLDNLRLAGNRSECAVLMWALKKIVNYKIWRRNFFKNMNVRLFKNSDTLPILTIILMKRQVFLSNWIVFFTKLEGYSNPYMSRFLATVAVHPFTVHCTPFTCICNMWRRTSAFLWKNSLSFF